MTRLRKLAKGASEFVLIVVGVLVALGVDTMAEGRREAELGRQYLVMLQEDLREDSIILQGAARGWERQAENADLLLSIVEGAPIPEGTSLFGLVRSAGRVFMVRTVASTFREMTASGSVRLLDATHLRVELAAYYDDPVEDVPFFARVDLRFRSLQRELLPPVMAEVFVCEDVLTCGEPEGFDAGALLSYLRRDASVSLLLRSRVRDLQDGYDIYSGRVGRVARLLREIDAALSAAG